MAFPETPYVPQDTTIDMTNPNQDHIDALIRNAYQSYGIQDIGLRPSNIKQAEYDDWYGKIKSGDLSFDNTATNSFNSAFFSKFQNDYRAGINPELNEYVDAFGAPNQVAPWDNTSSQPVTAGTPGQVTMPSMANINVPGWIQELSKSIPQWFDSMNNLQQLPNTIDSWLTESLKNQRGTGDQVLSLLGNISEQQAGSGIMGGTEDTALRSRILNDFMRQINDNKINLTNNANTMKSQAISAMPGAAINGVNAMSSLYGQNASDQYNWANLAAQMLTSNY